MAVVVLKCGGLSCEDENIDRLWVTVTDECRCRHCARVCVCVCVCVKRRRCFHHASVVRTSLSPWGVLAVVVGLDDAPQRGFPLELGSTYMMGSKTIMMGTPLRNTYALSVWCCWHVICLFCWNNDLELKPDERLEKVLLLNAKEHFYTVTGHHLCSFRICWMWRLRSMHKTTALTVEAALRQDVLKLDEEVWWEKFGFIQWYSMFCGIGRYLYLQYKNTENTISIFKKIF